MSDRQAQFKANKTYRRARKTKKKVTQLAKQVAKNTAMLKQTVEGKQLYVETSNPLVDNTFLHLDLLDDSSQGVADTDTGPAVSTGARIGNSINVKSISLRMVLDGTVYAASPTNPAAKSGGMHRIIIYNSPCGEDLVATDILREGLTAFSGMRSHFQTQIAQGKMYNIWFDKTIVLSDSRPSAHLNFVKKWKDGKKVIYDGNSILPSNFRPKILVINYALPGNNIFSYSFKTKYEDL
jgi:hypothetical protein